MTEIIFVFLFLGIEKNRINYECHFDAQFPLDIWYGFVHRSSFLREAKAQTVKPNLFVWSVNQLVWFFRDLKMTFLLTGPGLHQ